MARRRRKAWVREHESDSFVRRAQQEGYRARAVYKLREIDARYQLLRAGMTVIDLGAAPGGWSQYARERIGPSGRILALDLLEMQALQGVEFFRGDIADPAMLDLIEQCLAGRAVDLVISDMAPNISGDRVSDQTRAIELATAVLAFAPRVLAPGGHLLLKAFQGEGFTDLRQAMRPAFAKFSTCKPQASRTRSREIYLLGQQFRCSMA
ncbi:MAG: RlmE family RNA methyltransferase [Acidiferrobacterales bacterium]